MRILAGGRVFVGQRQSPELDCAQETLTKRFKVLVHTRAPIGVGPKPLEGSDNAG